MTSDPTAASDNTMVPIQDDEIFFRAEDARLIGRLAEEIAGDLTSLELIGDSQSAIDHYGRILLTRLRQVPNIQLEAYTPTSVESLIGQFNAALSSISMAEATRGGNREKTVKVFIANEISDAVSHDRRMLARLVSNFPGANIKLIWVHQENFAGPRATALEFAGKHAARWFISPPTPAEAERMLADGARAGQNERVRQLLKKVAPDRLSAQTSEAGPHRLPARQEPALPRLEMPDAGSAHPVSQRDAAEGWGTDESARTVNAKRKMSWLAMINGILLVTCLSAAIIALIFPGHIRVLAEMLGISSPFIKPMQSVKVPSMNSVAGAPTVAALNDPAGKAEAGAAAADASATAPLTAEGQPLDTLATNTTVAPPTVKAGSTVAVAEKEIPVVEKNAPLANQPGGEALGKAVAQIKAAEKDSLFVQFVALDTYAAAEAWQSQYDKLLDARIARIRVEQGAKSKFVVVSGPFKSRNAAEAFAAQKGLPSGAWIREARPLQAALQENVRVAQIGRAHV